MDDDVRNTVVGIVRRLSHLSGTIDDSAVSEEAANRIARLVYLDAFIPRDGDSLFSMRPPDFAEYFRTLSEKEGEGRLIPPLTPEDFGVRDPEDVAWMRSRLGPVLLATFADPVRLPSGAAERLPRSYIFCTEFGFGAEAERARQEGWDYHELPTGHDPMVTAPEELASIVMRHAPGEGSAHSPELRRQDPDWRNR